MQNEGTIYGHPRVSTDARDLTNEVANSSRDIMIVGSAAAAN
jgi:hypothetical protein